MKISSLGVYSVGSAKLPSGRRLDVVASGNTVRFSIEGIDGHVDLKLNGYAANAATWLEEQHAARRLEELRAALRAESISYGELIELQGYGEAGLIPAGDLELREAAGLPEHA